MNWAGVTRVAHREARVLLRSRAARGAIVLLLAIAWLPPLLLSLRAGTVGLAGFPALVPFLIALAGVVLPVLALLAGAELLAGELEDGSLVPILTLPISRRACYLGKCLGRALVLSAAYVIAFASAGVAVLVAHGRVGLADYLAVAAAGLLLCAATGGLGIALGASGRGRVRAFGAALMAWLVLVFALDAVILAVVVGLAPPAPEGVGQHGHGELQHDMQKPAMPIHDPHAHDAQPESEEPFRLSTWLVILNPVDLFRFTALAAGPGLRPQLEQAFPGSSSGKAWLVLATGWLLWLLLFPLLGLRRFTRTALR